MRKLQRRLGAVLHADIVGFTQSVARDAVATAHGVEDLRGPIHASIEAHGGVVLDFVGDSFLAEFSSVLAAVQCAIELQGALEQGTLSERDATRDPSSRDPSSHGLSSHGLSFRMGVDVGDLLDDGTRRFGLAINIAARLQAMAPDGGICVSGTVHDQVHRGVDARFDDLGTHWLKNVPDPVRVYRVRRDTARDAAAAKAADRAVARMAVMLACDLAGVVSSAAAREAATLRSVERLLPLFTSRVRAMGGRIVHSSGDGLLAELATPADAVRCGLTLLDDVARESAQAALPTPLGLRVGVHMDEVWTRGRRLHGQGVHTCARLASRFPVGALYVTGSVADSVRGKLELELEELGELDLGTRSTPTRVARVTRAASTSTTRKDA